MDRKIAMYLRVSTIDQARNGYGLGDQETQCRKYIDLYYPEESENILVYKDDGYSAKDLHRPQMKKMLEDIKNGLIHTVIAFKLDRLTRSVIDIYELIKTVTDCDCNIIAVVDRIDISSANGRMLVGILSVISQWEREVISERTIAGLTQMVREGKYPYGGKRPPYGWKKENKRLIVDEYEAEVINYMAQKYISGYSLKDIKNKVYQIYNVSFFWKYIKELLTRKQNIGIFEYHGIEYENVIPAIMDIDTYNKVIDFASHREIHRPQRIEYTFHRMVYCKCGERLNQVCTTKHNIYGKSIYRYYQCPKCKKRISQTYIEKEVLKILNQREYLDVKDEYLNLLNDRINLLVSKKEEAFKLFEMNKMDGNQYIFTLSKLDEELEESRNKMNCMNLELHDFIKTDQETKYNYAHDIISRIIIDLELKSIVSIEYK